MVLAEQHYMYISARASPTMIASIALAVSSVQSFDAPNSLSTITNGAVTETNNSKSTRLPQRPNHSAFHNTAENAEPGNGTVHSASPESSASADGPMNERGTTPENWKWSNWSSAAGPRPDAAHEFHRVLSGAGDAFDPDSGFEAG